jgi:hypothetical protein
LGSSGFCFYFFPGLYVAFCTGRHVNCGFGFMAHSVHFHLDILPDSLRGIPFVWALLLKL